MAFTCCCCQRTLEEEPFCSTFIRDPKTGKKTRMHALCKDCHAKCEEIEVSYEQEQPSAEFESWVLDLRGDQ